jgi:hypothetical protein
MKVQGLQDGTALPEMFYPANPDVSLRAVAFRGDSGVRFGMTDLMYAPV